MKRRDNRVCQRCGSAKELEVHHVKPLRMIVAEFKEAFPSIDIATPEGLDFALKTIVRMHTPEMGLCLCSECHAKEDEWRRRFKAQE